MKVIYKSTILSVALQAGVADSQYPVENVRNEYPRKPFKAQGESATIRVAESGDGVAIALFATNADAITVTVAVGVSVLLGSDETGADIEAGTDEAGNTVTLTDRGNQPISVLYEYTKQNENNGVIWMEIERTGFQRTLDFACSVSSGNVEVGILDGGQVMRFRDMEKRAYQEAPVDHSIDIELQSGNPYYVDLGRARVIPFMVYMWGINGDDPEGYNTWRDFYYKLLFPAGKAPRAWLLSELLDVAHYAIWGRIEQMPRAAMRGRQKLVSTTIKEVN